MFWNNNLFEVRCKSDIIYSLDLFQDYVLMEPRFKAKIQKYEKISGIFTQKSDIVESMLHTYLAYNQYNLNFEHWFIAIGINNVWSKIHNINLNLINV